MTYRHFAIMERGKKRRIGARKGKGKKLEGRGRGGKWRENGKKED